MFQNQNSISIPFTNEGINISSNDNPKAAKYIENLLLGNNNCGVIRYGTYLESNFLDEIDIIYKDILYGTSYLKSDGTSENIIYIKYFKLLPFVNFALDVQIISVIADFNIVKITIDITNKTIEQIAYFKKVLYNDVNIYISQLELPITATISNFEIDDNHISFNLDKDIDSFNFANDAIPLNNFTFWVQRAAIHKQENNIFNKNALINDIDPNVIVSSINYRNYLIITNGVDPVYIYDGIEIKELLANASVSIRNDVVVNGNTIIFNVGTNVKIEYQKYLIINSLIILKDRDIEQENKILDILFEDVENNNTRITITCDIAPLENISNILYKKPLPKFSSISVGNDRLWALAEGRDYQNKFKSPELSQRIYYSNKPQSVFDWFNERTGDVDFIDISTNNDSPENIEIINCFQGEMLFIGRHTTQVWNNGDPTYNFDGQGDDFGSFKFQRLIKVGVLQKALCQELPNNLVIVSTYGKSFSFYRNRYGIIDVNENFVDPIKDYLKNQISFIRNDIDYREMSSFLYPYNNLIGIKIKNECLVYQSGNSEKGFWTTFSGNFVDSSFCFYSKINKNLYLGMKNGVLLTYGDKAGNQIYTDLDIDNFSRKKLSWGITYSNIWLNNTWNNSKINLALTSLSPLVVNVNIFINDNQTEPIHDEIIVDQSGSLFDVDNKDNKIKHSYQPLEYAYESIKFSAESFILEFNGFVDDYFIFEKIILNGDVNSNVK